MSGDFDPASERNSGAWFKYADNAPSLTLAQRRGLALGHIHAVAWDLPLNTLSLHLPVADAREQLLESWGVTGASSAREELSSLLEGGSAAKLADVATRPDTVRLLTDLGLQPQDGRPAASILAWDLGRVTHLSRFCFTAGLLAEPECWEWIAKAEDQVVATYSSLREFGAGLVIGRVCWSLADYSGSDHAAEPAGPTEFGHLFTDSLAHLVHDLDSPWKLLKR